jgi:hypothetical protein
MSGEKKKRLVLKKYSGILKRDEVINFLLSELIEKKQEQMK